MIQKVNKQYSQCTHKQLCDDIAEMFNMPIFHDYNLLFILIFIFVCRDWS